MKVLKFGGTSVGSAKNIQKAIEIVKNLSQESNITVVVSAIGGITNKLLNAANKAVAKDDTYKEVFNEIRLIHLDIIDELINSESNTKVKNVGDFRLSLNPQELKKFVKDIKKVNKIMGDNIKEKFFCEKTFEKNLRRSVYINKKIVKDEMLNKKNIKILRPYNPSGIAVYDIDKFINRKINTNLNKNSILKPSHFK